MSEDWDLRSNIKGKPGSQGTLFSGGRSQLNPERRWPRGYSPERRDAVARALKDKTFIGGEMVKNPQTGEREYPEQRAAVLDTIARSSVPTKHLYGLQKVTSSPNPGHLATYRPVQRQIDIPIARPPMGGASRDELEEGLIHEMGHHVSYFHTKRGAQIAGLAAAGVEDPKQRATIRYGVEEGVADEYAMEHFRTRGRDPKKRGDNELALYERIQGDKLEERFPGYTDVRPQRNLSSQFEDTLF